MRLFGSDRIVKIMERVGLEEGQELQHPWLNRSIGKAQERVEQHNFQIRKRTLEYDDVMNKQREVIYGFRNGIWASLDATYFAGGRTTLNGQLNDDRQENWRAGGTLALPVDRLNSIKFNISSGASARTGNNYDLYGIAWQHRWGGGL